MSISEFELIERFFSRRTLQRNDVIRGIGDDAAVLKLAPGMELVLAVDTLVAGVHFAPNTDAAAVGHKALAVNLSDLAAMGAAPAWATLALTLPGPDSVWLSAFGDGFFRLAERFAVALVGGDTTRGPLTISIQIAGTVPQGRALRRGGARTGDLVWVTGTVGDAGLGLQCLSGRVDLDPEARELCSDRLYWPQPRVSEGRVLRDTASAAIDISDGLAADLGKLLAASGVGARITLEQLPLSWSVRQYIDATGDWNIPLASGDDYELCFTVPPVQRDRLAASFAKLDTPVTCIGVIEKEPGLRCELSNGEHFSPITGGYDHFRGHS